MTANIPNSLQKAPAQLGITAVMPDFPFDYGKFLDGAKISPTGPFSRAASQQESRIAIIGGGISGVVAGYELLRAGFKPVIFEASDRIGGRMYSKKFANGGIAEMGAMRFPPSCKALFHYFEKVGMSQHMGNFPNPGTEKSPGTVVNYKGRSDYYDLTHPRQEKYNTLEKKWNSLLESTPYDLKALQQWMSDPDAHWKDIKTHWNKLIKEKDMDNTSFHRALVDAGWSFEDIELFGQVGFGSGGWNTNYVNCFLELLRVAYGNLETDHKIFYEGSDTLPKRLYASTPKDLNDYSHSDTHEKSLKSISHDFFSLLQLSDLENIVTDIHYNPTAHVFALSFEGSHNGTKVYKKEFFDAVIYTPHVRVLQMLRDRAASSKMPTVQSLLSDEMWEAVEYTHYMQSSKTFVSAKSVFWEKKRDNGHYAMSTTLSDRATRGTYLLNYKDPIIRGDTDKPVICLTYTWNDDALKMLTLSPGERAEIALIALRDIYPDAGIDSELNHVEGSVGPEISSLMWDQEKFFMGAFKNNLPGHYRYQRCLFSHFAEADLNRNIRFFLAGDDISWTGGWAEGAITTGLNAAHAVVSAFGGKSHNKNGPLDVWADRMPIKLEEAGAAKALTSPAARL